MIFSHKATKNSIKLYDKPSNLAQRKDEEVIGTSATEAFQLIDAKSKRFTLLFIAYKLIQSLLIFSYKICLLVQL